MCVNILGLRNTDVQIRVTVQSMLRGAIHCSAFFGKFVGKLLVRKCALSFLPFLHFRTVFAAKG